MARRAGANNYTLDRPDKWETTRLRRRLEVTDLIFPKSNRLLSKEFNTRIILPATSTNSFASNNLRKGTSLVRDGTSHALTWNVRDETAGDWPMKSLR